VTMQTCVLEISAPADGDERTVKCEQTVSEDPHWHELKVI
jgi:hypothetical protein